MTDSLGSAALYLTVDTTGMETAISRAQARVRSYGAETGAAIAKLEPAMQKQAKRWLEQADNATVAKQEVIAYKAVMANMPTQVIDELKNKWAASAKAVENATAAAQRNAAVQAEAARRVEAETAARLRNAQAIDAQIAKASAYNARLAQMRDNAQQAFGVEMGARERAIVGMQREEGVRDRLNNLLKTERGQRILAAEAARNQGSAIAGSVGGINNAGRAFAGSAMSAKQLQFAMRGLPAQFTDIGVSLASGQRPLLVLLQQGGQLKDMFGGIRPALGAVATGLRSIINPATLAAAAVGGIAYAMVQAQEQAIAFNRALIATGNFAGRTSDDMQRLAASFDNIAGVTTSGAAKIIAEVAKSGQFTGEVFDQVSEAAVRASEAGIKSVEEVIDAFREIGKDPVAALLKLDQAENFLTKTQIERIRVLQNEGREQDAVREATELYLDVLAGRSAQAYDQINSLASAWRNVSNEVRQAFSNVVNFDFGTVDAAHPFGTAPGVDKKRQAGLAKSGVDAAFNSLGKGDDLDPKEDARRQRQLAFQKQGVQYLTGEVRLLREIADMRKEATKDGVTLEAQNARAAAMRRQFEEQQKKKEKRPRKPRDMTNSIQAGADRFRDMVGQMKAELDGPLEKVEQKHLMRMRELEQAAKKGKISHDELAAALVIEGQAYKLAGDEVRYRYESEIASLSGPIVQARQDHEDAIRRIEQLKVEAKVTGDQYNAMLAEEAERYREAGAAAARAADPIGALLSDMRREIDFIGMSNAERAVMNALLEKGIDLRGRDAQAAMAQARAIEAEGEARQQSIDLMDDFRQGAEDALVSFVTGAKSAKDALKDFFNELAAQLVRAAAKNLIANLFGQQGSKETGSSGNWLSVLIGAFTGTKPGGFASGGYTGDGPANEVAGVVHRGEYVIPANVVKQIRGGGGSGGGNTTVVNYTLQGRMSRQVEAQIAQRTLAAANRSYARNAA